MADRPSGWDKFVVRVLIVRPPRWRLEDPEYHRTRRGRAAYRPLTVGYVRLLWTAGACAVLMVMASLIIGMRSGGVPVTGALVFLTPLTGFFIIQAHGLGLAWRRPEIIISLRANSRFPVHRFDPSDGVFQPDDPVAFIAEDKPLEHRVLTRNRSRHWHRRR